MADPDKLFQDAINAVQGVKTPDANQMMVTLQNMVQQGQITPEQMQTALVDRNAFDNIVSSPEFAAAQQTALTQLQQIGSEGGLTPLDRAKLQDIRNEQNTTNRGQEQAIMQNARERGIGGSGLEMASRLQAQQSAADRASQQGTDVAALAQQRALDAIQSAGAMGGQMQEAEFNRGAAKATSQNAIDAANAAMMNQGNLYNTQAANAAQAANLGEKQRVSDANVGIQNTQEVSNKALAQQTYQNELAKAQALAGTYNAWGSAEKGESAQKNAGKNAMIGTGLQTAGTVIGGFYGGPVGAAAGGTAGKKLGDEYAASNAAHGAIVPGEAKVEGDSEVNDTVPMNLSPGEMVIPRSLVSEFTKHSKPKGKNSKIDHEDVAMIFKALSAMKENC